VSAGDRPADKVLRSRCDALFTPNGLGAQLGTTAPPKFAEAPMVDARMLATSVEMRCWPSAAVSCWAAGLRNSRYRAG
jgi:hypothetical protein